MLGCVENVSKLQDMQDEQTSLKQKEAWIRSTKPTLVSSKLLNLWK